MEYIEEGRQEKLEITFNEFSFRHFGFKTIKKNIPMEIYKHMNTGSILLLLTKQPLIFFNLHVFFQKYFLCV